MNPKNYLTADDVAKYMGISVSMAYKVIRSLNEEMKKQGYITICGKVNRRFFEMKANGFPVA